ncbi:DUF4397 domain-containing protein [Pedobacter sp. MR2016-24]|uniref:DUF4397 domain-containing protein n=1 Tax=Pedobacter sp. MR2016-24 TaxID=2994466 RepID=UPI002245F1D8|nr:DUF4397 domain-containing protein [Pedobacter sp. MR2016-24]MCX2483090.1 DUF4397 domain-containing protein [Pedobacter sp. MR2016-24]
MKVPSMHINMLAGLALIVAATFSSCEKNDVDNSGQFRLKVVNASPTSGPQTFTLAGTLLVSNGLNYKESSDYITSPSGTRLVGEFKNSTTNSIFASGEIWTANNIIQTVYLAGQGSKARVKVFTDDLGTPNNNQVKVKFIDFSDNGPSVVKIRNGSGDDLVSSLPRNEDSGYKFIAPGTFTVQISSLTGNNNSATFNLPDLQAGKIYTIYFTDAADGSMVANTVLHN